MYNQTNDVNGRQQSSKLTLQYACPNGRTMWHYTNINFMSSLDYPQIGRKKDVYINNFYFGIVISDFYENFTFAANSMSLQMKIVSSATQEIENILNFELNHSFNFGL